MANNGLDQLGVRGEQRRISSLLEQSERGLRRGVAGAGAGAPAKGLGRLERQQRACFCSGSGGVGGHRDERQALVDGQGRGHADVPGEEEGVSREEQEVGVDGVRLFKFFGDDIKEIKEVSFFPFV